MCGGGGGDHCNLDVISARWIDGSGSRQLPVEEACTPLERFTASKRSRELLF